MGTKKPYTTKAPYKTTRYPTYTKPANYNGNNVTPNEYGVYPGPATTQVDAYCPWNESVQLLPNIISPIMILGKKWEEATGTQCYSDREGVRSFGEFADYIEFADIMDALDYVTEEDRRRREVREVASCKIHAGVINCNILDGLAQVKNEQDLANWIDELV